MTKKKNSPEEEIKNSWETGKTGNQDINADSGQTGQVSDEDMSEIKNKGKEPGEQEIKTDESDKHAVSGPSAEEKLAEMQDRYIRLSAEFDNYRKRTLREKIELTKHAGEDILKSIVPVLDDFERALNSIDGVTDSQSMKNGIDLIYVKFRDILRQNGLKEIEAQNQNFDVDLHEAISKLKVEDENMKGKVVDVVQKGYFLHDKVMRFSKVVVGE